MKYGIKCYKKIKEKMQELSWCEGNGYTGRDYTSKNINHAYKYLNKNFKNYAGFIYVVEEYKERE